MTIENRFKKPVEINLSHALINMCLNYSSWGETSDDQLKSDLNEIHNGLGDWFEKNHDQAKEVILSKLTPNERKVLGF